MYTYGFVETKYLPYLQHSSLDKVCIPYKICETSEQYFTDNYQQYRLVKAAIFNLLLRMRIFN